MAMVKPTRIYTRTGDDGTTGRIGGARVHKHAPRIEAYGTVDELSSFIGLARSALRGASATEGGTRRLDVWLAWGQDLLFNLGSELATPGDQRLDGMPVVDGADVSSLERAIDEAQAELKPLANFIHPGGSPPGAYLHVARTVCRRAERLLVAMRDHGDADISPAAIAYLNRLSDALLVWARWVNARLSSDEHIWNKASAPPPPA